MGEKLILPALARGEDKSRADELINVTATDSQSFLAVIHNTIYFDPWKRPATADAPVASIGSSTNARQPSSLPGRFT